MGKWFECDGGAGEGTRRDEREALSAETGRGGVSLFTAITRSINTTSLGTEITITALIDNYYEKAIDDRLVPAITEKLAEEFIKQRGHEVLKRLSEQTIDAKVIQKVVANLRKEMRKEMEKKA